MSAELCDVHMLRHSTLRGQFMSASYSHFRPISSIMKSDTCGVVQASHTCPWMGTTFIHGIVNSLFKFAIWVTLARGQGAFALPQSSLALHLAASVISYG